MDGGALAIRDGVLEGVESKCALTAARPGSVAGATAYRALCSAGGEEYSGDLEIIRTDTGVRITREGQVSELLRCPVGEPVVQVGGRWSFADRLAQVRWQGKIFAIGRKSFGDAGTGVVAMFNQVSPNVSLNCLAGQREDLRPGLIRGGLEQLRAVCE
jgi:hypothetical protein